MNKQKRKDIMATTDIYDKKNVDEEELAYEAFSFDSYETAEDDDCDLVAHDDERIINWDHDEYDFDDDEYEDYDEL